MNGSPSRFLYEWRYQIRTDVADAQPTQLEREARKAAIRDARHDGWIATSPPQVDAYEALHLENVTDLVVTFAVRKKDTFPQQFHKRARTPEYLPAQPLMDLVEGRPIRQTFTESQWRAYYRGRAAGRFTLDAADKLAIALGQTLETVWPSSVLSQPSPTLAPANEGTS